MRKLNIVLLPLALSLIGCSSGSESNEAKTRSVILNESEQNVVSQQNSLGVKLINVISEKETDNLIVSPISINFALGMLANGANGETLDEILSVIDMSADNLSQLNSLNARLLTELPKANSKVTLSIANSVWFSPDFNIKESFISSTGESYNADIKKIDLSSKVVMDEINRWVSNNTGKMIPHLLESPLNSKWALINAVYFNAPWVDKFKLAGKGAYKFNNADGSVSKPDFMVANHYEYSATEDFTAFQINYNSNNFCMQLFIPENESNAALTTEIINAFNAEFSLPARQIPELIIPKFNVEFTRSVSQDLEMLGLKKALGDDADFSAMCNGNTSVGSIIHSAKISVDENGTEAAAATTITGPTSSAPPTIYIIDKPFYFLIKEKTSNSTLFIGKINNL